MSQKTTEFTVEKEIGLDPVAHVEGGFNGWKQAGGPLGEKPAKRSAS